MKKYLLLIILFLLPFTSNATIYMQDNKQGQIIYSDTPLNQSSTPIIVPEKKYTTLHLADNSETLTDEEASAPVQATIKKPYVTFMISQPKDQDNIWNEPIIPVEITLDPSLQPGDTIQLSLDGNLVGNPSATTHLSLTEVERGTHQVAAVIMDQNNKLVKQSDAVTFYFHKTSVSFKTENPRTPLQDLRIINPIKSVT